MKGTHRILAIVIIALISVGIANYSPKGWESRMGENVEPAKKPALWGLTEPPVLQNINWEREGNVEVATLPRNAGGKLETQLKALGYYPVYANWSTCRWTIWTGKRTYYVGETGSEILIVRGSLEDVIEWADENSHCGKPGPMTKVIGPSPKKALSYTVSLIGEGLEKDSKIAVPYKWDGKIPWSLANYSLRTGNVSMLVLIYATEEQLDYARSLVEGKTLCTHALGYYALLVLNGPEGGVSRAYNSIEDTFEVGGAPCG
ncbi:hypothetical protein [Thermococcus sp.]|uniref:hypothetical protein n=1 Tax=Thermococcus sp. TaxID=35749 RepID=UPI0025F8B065|nr:hypothetical protein [Thermococcus sp.]